MMSKKIIILNGSPRAKGNTMGIIKAFTAGAEAAGHTVTRFDLQKMNIHPCIGCCQGGKDISSPCTQKDDMDKIYPAYREADVVVLASPLYYWTISGQLKCTFDRLFAVAECDANCRNPHKESVLLMAAEGYGFDESKMYYEGLIKHLGWQDLGQVLIGGVNDIGDIEGHPSLVEAEALGKNL